MSLYNMLNGVSLATFLVLPMLGKHADEYPRFRDCFIKDEEHPEYDGMIHVYTRVGGGNREDYAAEIAALRAMPEYVTDFDDSFDRTYASFVFRVPAEFAEDYEKLFSGRIQQASEAYKQRLYAVYPKLSDKFDELFASSLAT